MASSQKGRMIVFEGIDCSGKSTALRRIAEHLRSTHGEDGVLCTREPGGCDLAEEIRALLLRGFNMTPQTEAMLFYSARMEHCAKVIVPALNDGKIVLCDRYYHSSLAYQGAAGHTFTQSLHNFIKESRTIVHPDRVLLFDISVDTYVKRQATRGVVIGEEENAIESRPKSYFNKVLSIYRGFADDNIKVIDAERDYDSVYVQALEATLESL